MLGSGAKGFKSPSLQPPPPFFFPLQHVEELEALYSAFKFFPMSYVCTKDKGSILMRHYFEFIPLKNAILWIQWNNALCFTCMPVSSRTGERVRQTSPSLLYHGLDRVAHKKLLFPWKKKKKAHKNKYLNFLNTFKMDGEGAATLYCLGEGEGESHVLMVLYIADPYGAVLPNLNFGVLLKCKQQIIVPQESNTGDPAPDLRLKRDTKWKKGTRAVASHPQALRLWFLPVVRCSCTSISRWPGRYFGTALPTRTLKPISVWEGAGRQRWKRDFFQCKV